MKTLFSLKITHGVHVRYLHSRTPAKATYVTIKSPYNGKIVFRIELILRSITEEMYPPNP